MGGVCSAGGGHPQNFDNRGSRRHRRGGLPDTACQRLPSSRGALHSGIQDGQWLTFRVYSTRSVFTIQISMLKD